MTKKTKIVYVYLALFAFVLGFSFTLASQALASLDCCPYAWCEFYQEYRAWGHWVHPPGSGDWECVQTGGNECDVTYVCAEEP